MTTNNPEQSPAKEVRAAASAARRRLLAGGGGVLLAVQAKTALGTTLCQSPSAMVSGNTSPSRSPTPCSGGRSPGFWKQPQHKDMWTAQGKDFPTFKVAVTDCLNGQGQLSLADIKTQGWPAYEALPGVTQSIGLWAVLYDAGAFFPGENASLARHLAAAYLNAGAWSDYPIRVDQIREMWRQAYGGGKWCPSGPNMCGTGGWSAGDIVMYISGLFDDYASSYDGPLCKGNG